MNIINNNVDFYINKLKNNEFFSFTRWGDGEWLCAAGTQGMNCDKHIYFPELRDGLNNALVNNKNYYKATWDINHGQIAKVLPMITNHLKNLNVDINWVNAIIWEKLPVDGDLNKLVEQLEKMNFVIVSNKKNRDLEINYTDYIEIPSVNCFLDKERIKQEMINMTEKYDNIVFGLSASMATNVIVDELYDIIGDKCFMVDFGSIWDPFVGNTSRSYHKEYKNIKI